MGRRPDIRAGYVALPAIGPRTGKESQVLVSHRRLEAIAKRGMGHAKEAAYSLPYVLMNPSAVFEGIRRDEDEAHSGEGLGWLCYVGVPRCGYRPDGSETEPWPDQVFLVFVNDERVAYTWRWEKCDLSDARLPIDHEHRFRKRML